MRMNCCCLYNSWRFAVGYKYLTVENIDGRKGRIHLTAPVKRELESIREKFTQHDAYRTIYVLDLFDRINKEREYS